MDQQRLDAIRARCEDCGLEYPFPDYVLPDEIWKRIAPQPDGNGLLCPTCIAKRLDAIGLWYQEGYFKPDGYSAFNPLQAEVKRLTSDRDAWRRRAEAAIEQLCGNCRSCAKASPSAIGNHTLYTCPKFKVGGIANSCPEWEWRGPEVEKE
jgi:hypothetical protein